MNKLFEKLGVKPENHKLVSIMYFVFLVSGINTVFVGSIMPYIRESYNLDYAQSGIFLSANQLGNLFTLVIAGFLPKLIGLKRSALILGSGMFIGLVLMTLTGNPTVLFLAFMMTGLARGSWSNVCNTTIGQYSEGKTAALNVLHAVYAVGALLSPLVIIIPIALGASWKIAPITIAILALLGLILVAFSSLQGKTAKAPVEKAEKQKSDYSTLRTKRFWFVTAILFCYLSAESSIIGWFVSYFKDAGILTATASTFTPTILWSMIMVGRLVWAALAGKFKRERAIMFMGVAFCVSFLIMMIFPSSTVSVICIGLIGLAMSGIYPTTLSTLGDLSSPMTNGLCMGIASTGSVVIPSVVGFVADSTSVAGGITVILVICVVMLVLMTANFLSFRKN